MQLLMDLKASPDTLPANWDRLLDGESSRPYFQSLMAFVQAERQKHRIFPAEGKIFEALKTTPPEHVKVVLLGQDPYHGAGQAHGLAFSVPEGIALPPSLRNIFKELAEDLKTSIPTNGNLSAWADQGVLLLNTVLTVREGEAGSHQKKGWETFTDTLIRKLSDSGENLVFMLWGNHSAGKENLIDGTRHCILKAPHPSPLSAHRGFFGCRHFSAANRFLIENGKSPVKWH